MPVMSPKTWTLWRTIQSSSGHWLLRGGGTREPSKESSSRVCMTILKMNWRPGTPRPTWIPSSHSPLGWTTTYGNVIENDGPIPQDSCPFGFASLPACPAAPLSAPKTLAPHSGSTDSLDPMQLGRTHLTPSLALGAPIPATTLDGRLLTQVTCQTLPEVITGNNREQLHFLILTSPNSPIILGLIWLQQHNPHIDWQTERVLSWSASCHTACLWSASPPAPAVDTPATDPPDPVPSEYHDSSQALRSLPVVYTAYCVLRGSQWRHISASR